MKKIELLAPAGSFEKAKIAFLYGADAVYCGTSSLSLRTRADMGNDDLVKTIKYAHSIGKRVHVTLNIFAWDEKYEEIIEMAKILNEVKPDAIIAADGGVMEVLKKYAPDVPIHVSTQANVVSLHAANFWYKNGAKRVIMAREANKEQIRYIMENKPKDLEVEMFGHGAICFAYSGRCFLSDFLCGRSANLGDCAQSCRWSYNLYAEEKNNPGQLMPLESDENGTSIFSSKDLCLIKEIPEIIDMGVDSLKIEGRLKTEYYEASVVNAYRTAIDDYMKDPENYDYTKYLNELEKVKTRPFTTFYFNDRKNEDIQDFSGKQYNDKYEFGGKIVEEADTLSQLLADFSAIPGYKLLVHGGGRSATKIAAQLGIESKMVDGRRITDAETLKVVTMVYGGLVNKNIVAGLQAKGVNAVGLTGADMNVIRSVKRPVKEIDYGYVGDVKHVDAEVLVSLISRGVVPVMAPLTHDGEGNMLNTNADTIAGETAKALAEAFDVTLIYCFEKKGVLRDAEDEDSVIPVITPDLFKKYVDEGVIQGGMIPKLENSFSAVEAGVSQVVITLASAIDGKSGTIIKK